MIHCSVELRRALKEPRSGTAYKHKSNGFRGAETGAENDPKERTRERMSRAVYNNKLIHVLSAKTVYIYIYIIWRSVTFFLQCAPI